MRPRPFIVVAFLCCGARIRAQEDACDDAPSMFSTIPQTVDSDNCILISASEFDFVLGNNMCPNLAHGQLYTIHDEATNEALRSLCIFFHTRLLIDYTLRNVDPPRVYIGLYQDGRDLAWKWADGSQSNFTKLSECLL